MIRTALNRLFELKVRLVWLAAIAIVVFAFLLTPSFALMGLSTFFVVAALLSTLREVSQDARHTAEGLAAVLSCLAIVIAGYWYFVERRGIPKMNVTPIVQAWPIGDDKTFVRVELLFENVGNSAILIHPKNNFRLELGQVMPFRGRDADELLDSYAPVVKGGQPLTIKQTDLWPTKARITDGLDFQIEAGETERRYFKAIIPCEDGLIVNARVDIERELNWFQELLDSEERQLFWRGQGIAMPIDNC